MPLGIGYALLRKGEGRAYNMFYCMPVHWSSPLLNVLIPLSSIVLNREKASAMPGLAVTLERFACGGIVHAIQSRYIIPV